MKIYAIFASASDDEPLVRTLADGPEEAMELVKGNPWCCQQMTETAWAERVEEL
ncbi:MAG TPA: hypothetical protein VLH56_18365 [Dissulfurispiraceae bacterium]|nr:hypothetical protein [Dissulfurispiraceae bacterium]